MSIESELCDDCMADILMDGLPNGTIVKCPDPECGAEYKIIEVWDGDQEVHHRWLEQLVGEHTWL